MGKSSRHKMVAIGAGATKGKSFARSKMIVKMLLHADVLLNKMNNEQ